MQIGPLQITNNLGLAPMAGVTDRPFRQLCRSLGAGMAVSEMVASNPRLRDSRKTRLRMDHRGEAAPRIVQIAGADPDVMAAAARYNVAHGAQVVDINMGCPAKKVCSKLAGSALLADEGLVREILLATVEAVDVPVTLKTRTGTDPGNRNALRVARMAEDAGIAALALHGRTRADAYRGEAEYATIRAVKAEVGIPVWANGDIDSPEKAAHVLAYTGADGLLVGRAAQGRPWIFREISHYLATGEKLPPPTPAEVAQILTAHVSALHDFYGAHQGLRVARKHIGWYLKGQPGGESFRRRIMAVEDAAEQLQALRVFLAPAPTGVSPYPATGLSAGSARATETALAS